MFKKINSFTDYLLHNKRFSKHTIQAYKTDLNQFFSFSTQFSINRINQVNHKQIRNWIMHLKKNTYSPVSVNRKIASLKSFFKHAILMGWTKLNPTTKIRSLKTAKKLPGSISEDAMAHLFNIIQFKNSFIGIRDKTILLTFYCTGIRLSELINLKMNNIDLQLKIIKVLGKRSKERLIPIRDDLISLFLQLNKLNLGLNHSNSHMFINNRGKKLSPKQVYNIVKKYLSVVTTQSNASPHLLRHTFATHMLENDVGITAIKELLGHASLAATQRYTSNSLQELKEIYKQTHPRGN